jgi:hypothetical protein
MNDKNNHMKNRQRGRNNGKPRPMGGGGGGGGGGRNPNFDGGNRPRGNAQQLMEKFLAMARDASSAGDRVLAENYYQHADHYYRVLNARFEQQNGQGNQQGGGQQHHNNQQNNNQGNGQQHNNGRPQYQSNDDNRGNQMDRPQDQGYDHQPHHTSPQQAAPQQVNHSPAPQLQPQPQSQPEPAAQNDGEIGLPPGILGVAPPVPGGAETEDAGEGDAPRPQQGRRRRGPPRERAGAGE